jgi:23S rRNA G2069 N7-methylase RlmK/C1962 C5-methylase RlmI
MSETIYPEITLRKNEERRLTSGHLWAFSNELLTIPKDIAAGAVVRLVREKGGAFALGFYNPHSLISARIISRELHDTIDEAFFEKKILAAGNCSENGMLFVLFTARAIYYPALFSTSTTIFCRFRSRA